MATGQRWLRGEGSRHSTPTYAKGGDVLENSIIVGEEGPEIFVPDSDGTIMPNPASVEGDGITINIEQPADVAPVIIPEPSSEPIILDFLQKEINEVEDDVKNLRDQCLTESLDTENRITVLETIVDNLVDRVADIIEAIFDEPAPEPITETPSPSLPTVSDKERRKRDKAPKPSSAKKQLVLGRSGGIFSKNEGVYP